MEEKINKLLEYADCDSSAWGDTVRSLTELWRYSLYLSPELSELLDREISDHLLYVIEHSSIITRKETVTVSEIKWKT